MESQNKTNYIFLTGGVISSLGKGITTSSISALLKSRGFSISVIKIDGYLNYDAGLMSPYEHGEVFVTEDGGETDLDIGNYERFIDQNLTKENNITSGKIYFNILRKERRGEYLGKTVQVVPHVVDEIKECIFRQGEGKDFVIVEIGGVVGDMESMSFIEAARQIHSQFKRNSLFIHLALVPYFEHLKEVKTKPLQNSMKQLQSQGIFPDILICRTKYALEEKIKQKISRMTNISYDDIVESKNIGNKYLLPLYFFKQKLDLNILWKLHKEPPVINFDNWIQLEKLLHQEDQFPVVNVGFVRKYSEGTDNYVSLLEAIRHACWHNKRKLNLVLLNTDQPQEISEEALAALDCMIIPGGFGVRGVEQKIRAVKIFRKLNKPFLGICLGFQCALVEMARTELGLADANSTEFDKDTANPVIEKIDLVINQTSDETGFQFSKTLRIGGRRVKLSPGSLAREVYQKDEVVERFRHRYSFNVKYKEQFEKLKVSFSGQNVQDEIQTYEIFELRGHKFFVGVQFHPEFLSRPFRPHPLINELIKRSN